MKLFQCPFCKKTGFLILNGIISGFSESSFHIITRGHTVICSARRAGKRGCGKSFSLFLSKVIKYHTVSTESIWKFLINISSKMTSITAFRTVLDSYSDRTIQRFRCRFKKAQFTIRTNILSLCTAPLCTENDPLLQTIAHLRVAFQNSSDPISDYQIRFMTSLF